MFQTTRRRLALWYTSVTAILLLSFATGVYFYVRSTLIERIDDTLEHVVEVVSRSLVIEPIAPKSRLLQVNIESSFRDNFLEQEDDHIDLEWFTVRGSLEWSTLPSPIAAPLIMNSNRTHTETVRLDATRLLRQVTQRIQLGPQVLGYLRVSHPWFEVTKPIRELFVDLTLGISGMIGIVAAVGWFLSGLAMQPIRDSYQTLRQFTADASHELRNPIAIIQTNVQVALSDPDPNPIQTRSHLQVVERLTRRLGKLVDDLLFLARQDSGIIQPQWGEVDLRDLVEEVLEEQGISAAEKDIELKLVSDVQSAKLMGDRSALARLLTNLVSNAIFYTPNQGSVKIELQTTKRNNHAIWTIRIIDTGIGIPELALPQLFDRFYRVDPARTKSSGRTGLGLAIVQTIVTNHQGTITVESKENQGTTFTVSLPQSF